MKEPGNVMVVTGWSWKDPLIQVYTLPYVRIIRRQLPPTSRLLLVTMEAPGFRLPADAARETKKQLASEGIAWLPLSYRTFGARGLLLWVLNGFRLAWSVLTLPVHCLHAWCMPAGSLAYLLSFLRRSRLIIDSYEPHAEAMVENGTWPAGAFRFRILFSLEKKLTKRADAVVAVTAAMREYALAKYGAVPSAFFVKPACIDLEYFNRFVPKEPALLNHMGLEGKIVGLYAGKFGGIYLAQEVFDFFKVAEEHWGDRFRLLILTGTERSQLEEWMRNSGLPPRQVISMRVDPADMPRYIGLADFAITPVKPVPTKRYCTPIKDGEYWAMGLPVVITRNISDDSDLIRRHDAGFVLEGLGRSHYVAALHKIEQLISPDRQAQTRATARSLAEEHRNLGKVPELYRLLYAKLFPG